MLFSVHPKRVFLQKFFSLIGIIGLLLPLAGPASAGLFSAPKVPVPNANEFASDMEQRYHINTENIQDQGETLNVSENKKGTPQVSLFFTPSDPQEGQKITARSFPIYFSSESSEMYFTWYLQRKECTKNNSPSAAVRARCDLNNDSRVNAEDWKIEAARIIATNGYDANYTNYSVDTDNDGYTARFGGDSRVNVPNHCYYHDNSKGENYELVGDAGTTTFNCAAGLQPVCMEANVAVDPGEFSAGAIGGSGTGGTGSGGSGGDSGTGGSGGTGFGGTGSGGNSSVIGDSFDVTGNGDTVTGFPYCSGGTVACITGTPCCVSNPSTATNCTVNITGSTCSAETSGDSGPVCRHLFPKPPGFTSGDGDFGKDEERFWRTDPSDPNTSDNGNKDEANVVGLGQEGFTWNYSRGDKVGVVVEGASMIPTKHDDSSNMIMWAFSKNTCDYRKYGADVGTYQKSVRGYTVTIPTTDLDINSCLEDNLVDPLEGGQGTGLEVELNVTPTDPINDSTGGNTGDIITVTTSVNNSSQELRSTFFDWKVYVSKDGTANPTAGWENINSYLIGKKMLTQTKGNGLDSLTLGLNIPEADVRRFLSGGVGYLKFQVDVAENFSASGANRRGKSDIIVKFISTAERIAAYIVNVNGDPARLSLNEQKEICSGTVNPADTEERKILTKLDAKLCRVIKNEIIGLKVIYPADGNAFTNFNWTINGLPLVCNTQVSAGCANEAQGGINFFPIIGNVGDVFTITVSATRSQDVAGIFDTNVTRPTVSEKTITLSRAFKIVEPGVSIASADTDQAWPKVLGKYVDANGKQYTDYSKTTLQAFAGSTVRLKAEFTPDFLGSYTPPQVERSWAVDGESVGDGTSNEISFSTLKKPGEVYNVTLSSAYRPSTLVRKALQDIWKISSLDSTELYFKTESQLEHPEQVDLGKAGQNKYLALLSSYVPAPLLFAVRIFLSVGLIIFVTGFVFALIPNAPTRPAAFVRRR